MPLPAIRTVADERRPVEAYDCPKTFGVLDGKTEDTPTAMATTFALIAAAVVLFLVYCITELANSGVKAGDPVAVDVQEVSLTPSQAAASAAAFSSGDAARVATQSPTGTALAVQPTRPANVAPPAATTVPASTVDTSGGSKLVDDLEVVQAGTSSGLQKLKDQIIEAQLSGENGLGGIFSQPDNVKSVVYVLDCSGSMLGGSLDAVVRELTTGLNSLKPHQLFSVLFYDDGPYLLPASGSSSPKLVPATPDNIRDAETWSRGQAHGGSTDPRAAMQQAIDMKPELIYLLSDGEFDTTASDEIVAYNANRRNAKTIHCVGVSEQVIDTLRTIAGATGGTYYRAR